jgi:multidrug transporter EmrE-like cation transporter
LQLFAAGTLDATIQFPILTGGTIIFTAVAGRVFFKEKFTGKILAGLAMSLAGTLMFLF